MTRTSLALDELRGWIGRSQTATDVVNVVPARALAATLDLRRTFEEGDALPPPWHWQYFLSMSPMAEVGPDGHPQRGGFLPPVPLPRRMWAGSRIEFHRPLRIGDAITRVSRIADVTLKEGRSGTLVFVKVRHEIAGPQGPALTEEHDIVYRDMPKPDDPAPSPRSAPAQSTWRREIRPDPVLLFRYSALTFNSHRIHYDHPYVTEVEGLPRPRRARPADRDAAARPAAARAAARDMSRTSSSGRCGPCSTSRRSSCAAPSADGKAAQLVGAGSDGFLAMDATARLA